MAEVLLTIPYFLTRVGICVRAFCLHPQNTFCLISKFLPSHFHLLHKISQAEALLSLSVKVKSFKWRITQRKDYEIQFTWPLRTHLPTAFYSHSPHLNDTYIRAPVSLHVIRYEVFQQNSYDEDKIMYDVDKGNRPTTFCTRISLLCVGGEEKEG